MQMNFILKYQRTNNEQVSTLPQAIYILRKVYSLHLVRSRLLTYYKFKAKNDREILESQPFYDSFHDFGESFHDIEQQTTSCDILVDFL